MENSDRIKIMDLIIKKFQENSVKGYLNVDKEIHQWLPKIGLDPSSHEYSLIEDSLIKKGIVEETGIGMMITDFGRSFKGFQAEIDEENEVSVLTKENLKLQVESLKYEGTIRGLKEQLLFLNLLKEYWWFVISCISLGGAITKILKL